MPIVLCPECGQEKEYYAKGLCKPCHKYRWYQENRQEQLAYFRRYYQEHKEEKKASQRRHRQGHKDEIADYNRRYYEAHREGALAHVRRWRCENPGKSAAYEARRQARKSAVANTLTAEQLEYEREIGEATYPGEKLALHHIVPLSKGGGHSWGNIAFIPASLNSSIGNKLPQETYRQLSL